MESDDIYVLKLLFQVKKHIPKYFLGRMTYKQTRFDNVKCNEEATFYFKSNFTCY